MQHTARDEAWAGDRVGLFCDGLLDHLDGYNASRHLLGQKPLFFKLQQVLKVHNPELEARFARGLDRLKSLTPKRTARDLRELPAFAGTDKANIGDICDKGLLRLGHPLNPNIPTDRGWFGVGTDGIYVSAHPGTVLFRSLSPLNHLLPRLCRKIFKSHEAARRRARVQHCDVPNSSWTLQAHQAEDGGVARSTVSGLRQPRQQLLPRVVLVQRRPVPPSLHSHHQGGGRTVHGQ